MPIPLAVAAFCVTTAVCHEKRKKVTGDQFVSQLGCSLFIQSQSYSFKVGSTNMSQFIESSISHLPSVTAVSVRTEHDRIQVEVTVDEFEWKSLSPIYQKELELSYAFREQPIDFRVIDASPYAGKAARAV
jgi:hypothetical protein